MNILASPPAKRGLTLALWALIALFLVSCTPLAPTTRDLASKGPEFFQSQVQVVSKTDHLKVYLSPMMSAGQGYVSNLIRCYRDDQKKEYFCQVFAKVETLGPLGDRAFVYQMEGKDTHGMLKVQKNLINCGTFCNRLNCQQACYQINLVTFRLDQPILNHLVQLSQLPPEARTPFRFELKGKGWNPKGELLPAALQGVLLKMQADVNPAP